MDTDKNFTISEDYPQFMDYYDKLKEITELVPREINYQLELIKPFLESVLSKQIQVIDTSNNKNGSFTKEIHTRESYTTEYGGPPDLILASEYKYCNVGLEPNATVYAAVEIKTPVSKENIYKEKGPYDNHVIQEIATYLCKCDNVILTDCKRWQFFSLEEKFDKRLLLNFTEVLPIVNLSNNNWWYDLDSEKPKQKPTIKDRLQFLKENKIDKINVFFEKSNKEEKEIIEQLSNYGDKTYGSCDDLLKKLNLYLFNCIREVVDKIPCKTFDLFPQGRTIYIPSQRYATNEIEEEDDEEWEKDLKRFLNDLEELTLKYNKTYVEEPIEWVKLVEYLRNTYNK